MSYCARAFAKTATRMATRNTMNMTAMMSVTIGANMSMDMFSSSSSESSVTFTTFSKSNSGAFAMAATNAFHQLAINTDGSDPGM